MTGSDDNRDKKTFLTQEALRKRRSRQRQTRRAKRGIATLGIVALLVLGFASAGALARGTSLLDLTDSTATTASDTTVASDSTSTADTSTADSTSTADTSTTDTTATDTTATDTTATDTTATDTTATDTTATDTTTTTGGGKGPKGFAPALVVNQPLPSSVQLYQWENGPNTWVTGENKGTWAEGDTIPFELDVSSIAAGSYNFEVCRDFSNGSGAATTYGYLKLNPYNATVTPSGDFGGNTVGDMTGSTGITINTATDTGATGSDCNAGQVEYDVNFSTDGAANRFIYWGGYLSKPGDTIPSPGSGNVGFQHSAGFFSGASLHMVLASPDKDRAINPKAIITLGEITVNKIFDAGATAVSFCFDISPAPPATSTTPNPQCTGPQNFPSQAQFLDLPSGTYSVTEEPQTGYLFNGTDTSDVNCTFANSTGSAVVVAATTPQFATCDFHNKQHADSTTVTNVKNSGGTTITDAAIGSTVHDLVTVSGGQGTPTGTVTFELFATQNCTLAHTDQSGVALVGGSASSSDTTVPASGLSYIAVYSGDGTYNGSTGACEPLSPDKVGSTTVTNVKNSGGTTITDAAIGSTVHDLVTVSGGQGTPTGTVTFELFATQNCTLAHTDQSGVALVGGSASSSDTTVPASGLSYIAVYSGDGTYNGSTGACEPLSPDKVGSTTVTNVKNSGGTTITDAAIGSTVHDLVTVSGGQGTPTGTVTFELFATQNCTLAHTDQSGVALVGGSASSSDTTVPASGLSYIAVYSGDGTYNGSTGACEPLSPDKVGSTTVTNVKNSGGTTITDAAIGSTVHDLVTVSGGQGTPTGTVTFELFATQNCTLAHTDQSGVALVGGSASSSDTTVPASGLSYIAVYSGDGTYNGSTGACEPLSPDKVGSTTVTNVKNSGGTTITDAAIGSTVHDLVTVSGGQGTPTGTVTFELFATQNCTLAHTDQSGVALVGGSASSSDTTVPASGLSYIAVYSGDGTYNGSTGDCEPLTGDEIASSATTTILGPDDETPVTSVDVGTIVHDSVTVTGSLTTPTGTVTFSWFENGLCTGDAASTSGSYDLVNGSIDASDFTQTAAPAGTYAFQATYSGDDTYLPSTSDCEPLLANPLQPTIGTTPSAGGNVGVVLNDSATLGGGYQPQGTITFKLYGPGNSTCSTGEGAQAPVFTQDVGVDGNDTYSTTGGYTTGPAGTYHWVAIYGGDANNNSAASGCTEEPVTVTNQPSTPTPPPPPPPPPVIDLQITKTGSPSPTTTGTNITWTMVVTNNGPDTATGVNVGDPLPAGTTFVSVATTQGTCAGGALITCQLGTIADGGSVTITVVTTAVAVGTDTNTATVVGNEQESNTANNTASAQVVVNAPPGVFKPPKPKAPVYCAALMVSPKSLFAGRHAVLTMKVFKHAKPVSGIKVRINGGGLLIITNATNRKGVVKRGVLPKKAGIVTFRPVAQKSCKNIRIGVIGVFTPPVTG